MLVSMARWVLFAALNSLVGAATLVCALSWRTCQDADGGLAVILLDWVTLALSAVVAGQTVLGILGLLAWPYGLGASALLLIASLVANRRALRRVVAEVREWVHGLWKRAAAPPQTNSDGLRIALLCLTVALVIGSLAEPSTMFDTLAYHLPMAVDWYQHGALTPFYLPNADLANSYFPGNGELLLLWSFLPLQSDVLVGLTCLMLWALVGLAISCLLLRLGTPRRAAVAVAVVSLLSPVALSEAMDPAWDVASTGFYFLAVAQLVRLWRHPAPRAAILFGLAGGLHLGTKYSGPAYVAVLGGLLLLVLYWRRSDIGLGTAIALLVASGLCVVLTGGFWYVRNLAQAGNPVFPLGLTVFGKSVWRGVESPLWDHIVLGNHLLVPGVLQKYAAAWIRSYGVVLPLLLLVLGVVGSLSVCSRESTLNGRRVRTRSLVLVGSAAVATTLLYLRTPYSIMRYNVGSPITVATLAAGTRFSLVAVVSWVVFAALLFVGQTTDSRVLRVSWAMVPLALLQSVIVSYDHSATGFIWRLFTYDHIRLAITLVAGLVVAWSLLLSRSNRLSQPMRPGSLGPPAVAAVLAVLLVGGLGFWWVEEHRARYRAAVYRREYGLVAEGWAWLASNVSDSRVAYTGLPLSLPLYGPDYSNEVRYINIAGELGWRHHDFAARGTHYRAEPASYEAWLGNLRAWSASHFVCSGDYELAECEWADAHPESFSRVYESSVFQVYRLNLDS